MHLKLPLLVHSLKPKNTQNNSSDSGLVAALEGGLDGGLNFTLEDAP